MTIGTNNRNDAVGNDAASVYPYGFKIFAATDLEVTLRDTNGIETTLSYPTAYSVSGVGGASGGSVTLASLSASYQNGDGTLKNGYAITIRRVRPLTQSTDIRNQGGFFAATHEDTFDHLMMVDQQQQDEIDRSLKIPATEAGSSLTTIPAKEVRASKVLGFDANGDPTLFNPTLTIYGALRDFQVAIADQTVFSLPFNYVRGINCMAVTVNGLRLRIADDFTESADNQVTLTYGLRAGDEIEFYAGQEQGSVTAASATTTQLTDKTSTINTVNKYAGKFVRNTTTGLMLYAIAATDVGHWYSFAGADTHTPV